MINNISFEEIRKNWSEYKDDISEEQYNLIWNDLINKFNLDKSDDYLVLFIKFISGKKLFLEEYNTKIIQENDDTLIIKGLDGQDRKTIHKLCNHIGLHHQSIKKKKNIKHLYIYKPKKWLWEFSERNPYSENDEVYIQREIESQIRYERQMKKNHNLYCNSSTNDSDNDDIYKHGEIDSDIRYERKINKMHNLYCCECGTYDSDNELYQSIYIRGIYCNDCLETTSDGVGGLLSDHKFEPL